jgi:hypothetical protein
MIVQMEGLVLCVKLTRSYQILLKGESYLVLLSFGNHPLMLHKLELLALRLTLHFHKAFLQVIPCRQIKPLVQDEQMIVLSFPNHPLKLLLDLPLFPHHHASLLKPAHPQIQALNDI